MPKLDKFGHLIIDHDLHNHNGELPNGIAEAFIDWAKRKFELLGMVKWNIPLLILLK